MGAGEVRAELGTAQPVDCLAVKAVGGFTVAQQRVRAGLEAQAVVRAARLGGFRQPFQRIPGGSGVSVAYGGLDQLGQRPHGDIKGVVAGLRRRGLRGGVAAEALPNAPACILT